jgi:hypothetical protein
MSRASALVDYGREAALILARLGRDRDFELEEELAQELRRAHDNGVHEFELKIAMWGDIEPKDKEYILGQP